MATETKTFMQINRQDFLRSLETVQPGLAVRETIEHGQCFAFKGGRVHTYNDELTCSAPSGFDEDFVGVCPAAPLLEILRKRQDAELEFTSDDGKLIMKGKRGGKSWLRMETEIALPLDQVDVPETWKKVPEDFLEAISIVQQCAGKDESKFFTTTVHIHPKHVEASDDIQWCRYNIKTGIKESTLVRRDSIKHIVSMGVTEFAETPSWIHFRNGTDWTLSCRRYIEMDFPDLTQYLEFDGDKTTFPKGVAEAADKANVFSMENKDNNKVTVKLTPGKISIKGEGISGGHSEPKKIDYTGNPIEFLIAPQLLIDLVKRQSECTISPERLKIESGNWSYVVCLAIVEGKAEKEEAAE